MVHRYVKSVEVRKPYQKITPSTTKQDGSINPRHSYHMIRADSNKWIELACEEAVQSVKEGGGPFGAVLIQVDDYTNEAIRYWKDRNQVTESNDPTAHAEVSVIRSACHELGVFTLSDIRRSESKLPQVGETSHCELYSSCEPCPMCYSAAMWARIPVLVFSATRYDAAEPGVEFLDEQIHREVTKSYPERSVKVYWFPSENALKAFRLWRDSGNTKY